MAQFKITHTPTTDGYRGEVESTGSWVGDALQGRRVVNIGQLTKADIRALDKEVRAGRLMKTRDHWTYVGGLGLGPLKTVYCLAA